MKKNGDCQAENIARDCKDTEGGAGDLRRHALTQSSLIKTKQLTGTCKCMK